MENDILYSSMNKNDMICSVDESFYYDAIVQNDVEVPPPNKISEDLRVLDFTMADEDVFDEYILSR